MPATYLGDTPIFQATMSERERNEFENFKRKVTTMPKIEQPTIANFETIANEKETIMPENTAVKTIANDSKKETTMPKTTAAKTRRLTRDEWKAQYIAELQAKADKLATMEVDLPEPTSLYHKLNAERLGIDMKPLHASALEKKALILACIENGWQTTEFISANQAGEYGGEPKADAKGIKLHGPNVARGYTIYNESDIVWAEGEPVWQEDVHAAHQAKYAQYDLVRKAKAADKRAKQAATAAKQAKKAAGMESKAKTKSKAKAKKAASAPAPAASNDVAAMAEMMQQLMLQNQQLIAALMASKA